VLVQAAVDKLLGLVQPPQLSRRDGRAQQRLVMGWPPLQRCSRIGEGQLPPLLTESDLRPVGEQRDNHGLVPQLGQRLQARQGPRPCLGGLLVELRREVGVALLLPGPGGDQCGLGEAARAPQLRHRRLTLEALPTRGGGREGLGLHGVERPSILPQDPAIRGLTGLLVLVRLPREQAPPVVFKDGRAVHSPTCGSVNARGIVRPGANNDEGRVSALGFTDVLDDHHTMVARRPFPQRY